MKDAQPLVTIVIIAYNEERYISQAIQSGLDQTYANTEIIVVDDGSRDDTVKIAKSYEPKIKVISQKNSGNCSFPRNAGLSVAKGEYVSFLDADDILLPQKIETQVAILQSNPSAAFVVSDYCNFRDEELQANHFSTCPLLSNVLAKAGGSAVALMPGEGADIMLQENFTIASSPLFRTATVESIGGFATDLYACEDYHLNYRLAASHPVVVNPQVLFHRRLHGSNMSSNSMKMRKYYFESRLKLMRSEKNIRRKALLKGICEKMYWRHIKCTVKQGSLREFVSATIKFFIPYWKRR